MSEGPLRGGRGRVVLASFLALLFGLLLLRWAIAVYVDLLWFTAENQAAVFRTRLIWEWGFRFAAGVSVALLCWLNLTIVLRTFAGIQIRRRFGDLVIQEQLPEGYVRAGVASGCALVGLWFLAAIPQGSGLRALLLLRAPQWGTADPIFGLDVRYHLFHIPALEGLLLFLLVLVVFLGGLVAAGYSATGAIRWTSGRVILRPLPRKHLALLGACFLFLLAIRLQLSPFGLLQSGGSAVQGIFGYTDDHIRIPAYRFLSFVSLFAAAATLWGVTRERYLPAAVSVGVLALASLGIGQFLPAVVQRFQVQPNELARESDYIRHAVEFTKLGFDLNDLSRERFGYRPPTSEEWSEARTRLARLSRWTEPALLATFRQIEARFGYYDFHTVAFDRYQVAGTPQPVAVSVRELDRDGIAQVASVTWENLHLRQRFISGLGAVAGALNGQTDEGRVPMFLTGIPPEVPNPDAAPDGIALTRPQVYVGSRSQLYAVINPGEPGFEAPDGSPGVPGVDFPAGIRAGSFLRTLALAWHFQDANLLFASEVGAESRFVFRREVRDRVRTLAPFLLLPEEPYPVISGGRIVWVVEAFTASRDFPVSSAHSVGTRPRVNYLRNSVKATVDAVTGETHLYVVDGNDPLLATYRRAFPTLFHDLDEMPPELRAHLRYSRELLDVQSRVLHRFHQESPAAFHSQQDRWEAAREASVGLEPREYRPEYTFLTLPGDEDESFVLVNLLVPRGRDNLASFVAARWTPEQGGQLMLWDVPLESQFRGPSQIESLVEQDPDISQQFSLWRQGGSQVWTGHLHLVPVGNTLIYMEPVFLAADFTAIPEIRRYVVSDGQRVVMDPTLDGAITALSLGIEGIPAQQIAEGPLPPEAIPEEVRRAADLTGAREALDLLDEAELRLREGDWQGFGRTLDALRTLLSRLAGGEGGT